MDAATIYTLITVTVGGAVYVTEFKTEALCLDARSLALYGETAAEHEASIREYNLAGQRAQEECEANPASVLCFPAGLMNTVRDGDVKEARCIAGQEVP